MSRTRRMVYDTVRQGNPTNRYHGFNKDSGVRMRLDNDGMEYFMCPQCNTLCNSVSRNNRQEQQHVSVKFKNSDQTNAVPSRLSMHVLSQPKYQRDSTGFVTMPCVDFQHNNDDENLHDMTRFDAYLDACINANAQSCTL